MRNLDCIIPNTFALQSVPKCVSNLLTIQAVFLALALAAPTMLAEPLAPVPPNTASTKVKSSAQAILAMLVSSLVLLQPFSSQVFIPNSINHINCTNQKDKLFLNLSSDPMLKIV